MSKYLVTIGKNNLAIAICDRCKRKKSITELNGDRNAPGLRVCNPCNDIYDPWKLPARATENISLLYPRPDTPLDTSIIVPGLFIVGESELGGPDVLG